MKLHRRWRSLSISLRQRGATRIEVVLLLAFIALALTVALVVLGPGTSPSQS